MKTDETAPGADGVVLPVEFGPAPMGYYLSGDDGQPSPDLVWCRECGLAAADRGGNGLHIMECWAGDDRVIWCEGCLKVVDTGYLTSHGIAWGFGLFEEAPPNDACLEHAQILDLMLDSMAENDPRIPQVEAWFSIASGGLVR